MPAKIDIPVGTRFGRLTVIEEVERHITAAGNKYRRMLCRCDCGNEKAIKLNSLRHGGTKSCGCIQKEMLSERCRVEAPFGKRFGQLTVIEEAEQHIQPSGIKVRQMLCQCDCGNKKVVLLASLRHGATKSCGCKVRLNVQAGDRFGRLTVIEEDEYHISSSGRKCRQIYCRCDCGAEGSYLLHSLRMGTTTSCGCFQKEGITARATKHGHTSGGQLTPEYRVWSGILARCTNPSTKNFHNYGGRGIKVCERWQGEHGFGNFYSDMGPRPSPKHSIDRIDNDGDYEPGNCQWSLPEQQGNNRRTNRLIEFAGVELTLTQWSRLLGIRNDTLSKRLDDHNWSVIDAFYTPPGEARISQRP